MQARADHCARVISSEPYTYFCQLFKEKSRKNQGLFNFEVKSR